MAGLVTADGRVETKPGKPVAPDSVLDVKEGARYVGRGGEKLAAALEKFGVSARGKRCLDIGASTGGFTDCLLKGGASEVTAVDVGYGQLAHVLRGDKRVKLLERTNARYLKPEQISYRPELITVDVSFISLAKIFPVAARLAAEGAEMVALIKPQFEAGRKEVKKGGVVRNRVIHDRVIRDLCRMCQESGFAVRGVTESPLRGPAGNKEFFVYAVK